MDQEFDGIVTLTDEEGVTSDFELYDFVELDNQVYLRLIPVEQDTEEEDVAEFIILKLINDESDCDECLVTIDGDELDAVIAKFEQCDTGSRKADE